MTSSFQNFDLARLRWLVGMSHIRVAILCLYKYPCSKHRKYLRKDDVTHE